MTEKEIARRLREALADNEPVGTINCDALWKLADELDPSGPEPGTVVWHKPPSGKWSVGLIGKCYDSDDDEVIGVIYDGTSVPYKLSKCEWKPAHILAPDEVVLPLHIARHCCEDKVAAKYLAREIRRAEAEEMHRE